MTVGKQQRILFIPVYKNKAGFKKLPYEDAVLWALSDSLLDNKPAGKGRSMNAQSPLFKIGDTTIPVEEWINYGQVNRYKADRSTLKPYPELMDEFNKPGAFTNIIGITSKISMMNSVARWTEFRDGNLFFEIMQQEIWNKAQADSTALLSLYEKNKNQYNWKQSADAVIFFCSDEATAKTLCSIN